MHEQKNPRSEERGVFCWAAAGSIPAGAQPVRRRDAAKLDPRASRGHAIERRANVVREKAGKPRTQPRKEPQKEPRKCRKSAAKRAARRGTRRSPVFFFARFATRRRGRSIRAAHRRVPRASRFAAPSRFNAGLALECGIDVRHRRRAVRQRARSIASVAASPAEQPRRPLNADRPAARRNRVPRGECRSAHPSRPSCR